MEKKKEQIIKAIGTDLPEFSRSDIGKGEYPTIYHLHVYDPKTGETSSSVIDLEEIDKSWEREVYGEPKKERKTMTNGTVIDDYPREDLQQDYVLELKVPKDLLDPEWMAEAKRLLEAGPDPCWSFPENPYKKR